MAYSRYENFAAPEFDYKPSNNIKVQPWQESDVVPPDISTNVPMPEIESMYPFPARPPDVERGGLPASQFSAWSAPLQQGQSVAWGSRPDAPLTPVETAGNVLRPVVGPQVPQVQRPITMEAGTFGTPMWGTLQADKRQTMLDPKINPKGQPLSDMDVLMRRKALYRPNELSPKDRAAIQKQIAGEAGEVAAQERYAREQQAQQEKEDIMEREAEKKERGRQKGAAPFREAERMAKQNFQEKMLDKKTDQQKTLKDYQAGLNELKAQADNERKRGNMEKAQQYDVEILERKQEFEIAEAARQQQNIVETADRKFKEAIASKLYASSLQATLKVYDATRKTIDALEKSGDIDAQQAAGQRAELSNKLEENLRTVPQPTVPQGASQTDANGNGVPDSLEGEYNTLMQALDVEKAKETQDAAKILKLNNAIKNIKAQLIPKG